MPNENIMGVPSNPCVNGITKADTLEIRKIPTLESETAEIINETIPSLDDRVTALEQGSGSGGDWIRYTSENTITDIVDINNYKFIKDVKIEVTSDNMSWVDICYKGSPSTALVSVFSKHYISYYNANNTFSIHGVQINGDPFDMSSYPISGNYYTANSSDLSNVSTSPLSFGNNENSQNNIIIYYR